MQIIKDKNNVVLFAGGPFNLTQDGLTGPGFKAPGIKSTTHTKSNVESIPGGFRGGYFSYNKKWEQIKDLPAVEKSATEKLTEKLADLKAAQEGKPLSMVYLDKRLTEIETILGV